MVVDEFVAGHGLGFPCMGSGLPATHISWYTRVEAYGRREGGQRKEGFPTENSSEHRRTSSRRQLRQIFLKRLPQTMRALQLPVL